MFCGAIGKQKSTDSTLLEPKEAGKFETNLKPLWSLSKWTPKRTTAMSMSRRKVRWQAFRSFLGPILFCFLSLQKGVDHSIFTQELIEINLANIDSC